MRADVFFTKKYSSRNKAAQILKRGLILRDNKPLAPGDEVRDGDTFEFLPVGDEFVSLGGFKLERALNAFHEEVKGGVFADLGASTGGFCDCLIRHGATHIFCVDVGEGQLSDKLRSDPRVTVMDKTNARYLKRSSFPLKISDIVSDLSFISLKLILPAIYDILEIGGRAFVLFKPQFECEGRGLNKNGILPVRYHQALLSSFYDCACEIGLSPQKIVNAPLHEGKNIEYIILLKKGSMPQFKAEWLKASTLLYENEKKS